jgi:hypothetical protein
MVPELRIFCGFCAKGGVVFAYLAQVKFPNAFEKVRFAVANRRGSSQYKHET